MPCYSPLMGYKDEETGGITFRRENTKEKMDVACGQCIGCRLDRSRMWAMRITHEASLHDDTNGNCFITLTYRPKSLCTQLQLQKSQHIPEDWSLSAPVRDYTGKQIKQSHMQGFIKRLRKAFPNKKIKFYQCGEYGNICQHGLDLDRVTCPLCNLGRPHHHACIFNHSFDDLEPYAEQRGVTRYTSQTLEDLWGFGFVDVGQLEFKSAAYVARYIMKKITGVNAQDHYQNIDEHGEIHQITPETSTMSNGIGLDWYKQYKNDMFPSDEVPVPGTGLFKKVPRYYMEKLKSENEEQYDDIKSIRLKFRNENKDEYSPERLMDKYKIKKAQTSGLLTRNTTC